MHINIDENKNPVFLKAWLARMHIAYISMYKLFSYFRQNIQLQTNTIRSKKKGSSSDIDVDNAFVSKTQNEFLCDFFLLRSKNTQSIF